MSKFAEELWQGLGNAIEDVRQKVVEEPMYGREVTDGQESPLWPEAREAEPSLVCVLLPKEPEREQAQDIDLDR
jgi:hypothetical protein